MKLGQNVYKAESAVINGEVTLGNNVNVWYNAVIRADIAPICIDCDTNIQENAVLHVTKDLPLKLGKRVTVGHGAILHSCLIEDDVLIGMGAIVLDGAQIGSGSMIGAGALVGPGKVIPPNSLVVGVPGKVVRELTEEEQKSKAENIAEYLLLAKSLPRID